jgi:hypothetical protein
VHRVSLLLCRRSYVLWQWCHGRDASDGAYPNDGVSYRQKKRRIQRSPVVPKTPVMALRMLPSRRSASGSGRHEAGTFLCLLCLLSCAHRVLPRSQPAHAEGPSPIRSPGPAGQPGLSCAPPPCESLACLARLRGGGALSKRDGGRPSVWQPRDISATAQMREMRQKHLQAQREQTIEIAREKARELARQVAATVKVGSTGQGVGADSPCHADAALDPVCAQGQQAAALSPGESSLEGAGHDRSSASENGACSAIIPKGLGLAPGPRRTSGGAESAGDEWRRRGVHVYMPAEASLRVLLEGCSGLGIQGASHLVPPCASSIALDFPVPRLCREIVVYQPREHPRETVAGSAPCFAASSDDCRIEEIVDADWFDNEANVEDAPPQADNSGQARRDTGTSGHVASAAVARSPPKAEDCVQQGALDLAAAPMDVSD